MDRVVEPVGAGAGLAAAGVRHVLADEHPEHAAPAGAGRALEGAEQPVLGLHEQVPVDLHAVGFLLEERLHADRFLDEVRDRPERGEQHVRPLEAILHLERGQRAEEIAQLELRRQVVDHQEQAALAVLEAQVKREERGRRSVAVVDPGAAVELPHLGDQRLAAHRPARLVLDAGRRQERLQRRARVVAPTDPQVARTPDLRLPLLVHRTGRVEPGQEQPAPRHPVRRRQRAQHQQHRHHHRHHLPKARPLMRPRRLPRPPGGRSRHTRTHIQPLLPTRRLRHRGLRPRRQLGPHHRRRLHDRRRLNARRPGRRRGDHWLGHPLLGHPLGRRQRLRQRRGRGRRRRRCRHAPGRRRHRHRDRPRRPGRLRGGRCGGQRCRRGRRLDLPAAVRARPPGWRQVPRDHDQPAASGATELAPGLLGDTGHDTPPSLTIDHRQHLVQHPEETVELVPRADRHPDPLGQLVAAHRPHDHPLAQHRPEHRVAVPDPG